MTKAPEQSTPLRLSRRLLIWPAGVAVVLGLGHFFWVAAYYELDVESKGLRNLLNLSVERGPGTWVSSVLLLAAAVAALSVSRRAVDADRRGWQILSVLLVVASLEEVAGFHEVLNGWMQNRLDLDPPFAYSWIIPGAVLAVVAAVLLFPFLMRQGGEVRKLLLIGGAVHVVAVIGFELVESQFADNGHAVAAQVTIGVQELAEIGGTLLVLMGLLDAAGAVEVSAGKSPRLRPS